MARVEELELELQQVKAELQSDKAALEFWFNKANTK